MNNKWIRSILLSFLMLALVTAPAFAISAAVKSQQDYVLTLSALRNLKVIIENFGTSEQQERFSELKLKFKEACERHYAQQFFRPTSLTDATAPDNNFQASVELFHEVKLQFVALLSEFSVAYIKRTTELLDVTSKEAHDILMNYHKESPSVRYFYRAINPLTTAKPYKAEEYHFFRDRQAIETYLKNGYKYLEDAKEIMADPDFIYIRDKQVKTTREIDVIIARYLTVINLCRQSKQYGIEIHKIMRQNQTEAILQKYGIDHKVMNAYPIFDDRIPEDYKVDAIDNQKLTFQIEKERMNQLSKTGVPAN